MGAQTLRQGLPFRVKDPRQQKVPFLALERKERTFPQLASSGPRRDRQPCLNLEGGLR